MTPHAVLSLANDLAAPMLDLLARLVETNSHADNRDGVIACQALLTPVLEGLGLAVSGLEAEAPHPHDAALRLRRRHLWADSRTRAGGSPRVLLMGHLDTVFPVDHPFRTLEREGRLWRGPGVSDMKGGIVTALLTLRLLERFGALDGVHWRVLLTSDEEQGSTTGAQLLARAAADVDLALSFEAARACGGLVVARKGYGSARLVARGKSGHAGIAHDDGVNALTALSRFIVAAEALEADHPEVTVSPGGIVRVTPPHLSAIPDYAECELEWRFFDLAAGERVQAGLFRLAKEVGDGCGARLELYARIETAPMQPTAESERLLAHYVRAAHDVGMDVRGVSTAGVGDINEVARLGAVCLDGVGPEGDHFHTDRECLRIDSIPRRAAMNALALTRYLGERRSKGSAHPRASEHGLGRQ